MSGNSWYYFPGRRFTRSVIRLDVPKPESRLLLEVYLPLELDFCHVRSSPIKSWFLISRGGCMPIMQMNMVYLYCKQKPQGLCSRPCIIRALFMAAIRSGLHKCLKQPFVRENWWAQLCQTARFYCSLMMVGWKFDVCLPYHSCNVTRYYLHWKQLWKKNCKSCRAAREGNLLNVSMSAVTLCVVELNGLKYFC